MILIYKATNYKLLYKLTLKKSQHLLEESDINERTKKSG